MTTAQVPTEGGNASTHPSGDANVDVVRYNTVAAAIMVAVGIPTLDLYGFVNQHCGLNYQACDWSAGVNIRVSMGNHFT